MNSKYVASLSPTLDFSLFFSLFFFSLPTPRRLQHFRFSEANFRRHVSLDMSSFLTVVLTHLIFLSVFLNHVFLSRRFVFQWPSHLISAPLPRGPVTWLADVGHYSMRHKVKDAMLYIVTPFRNYLVVTPCFNFIFWRDVNQIIVTVSCMDPRQLSLTVCVTHYDYMSHTHTLEMPKKVMATTCKVQVC